MGSTIRARGWCVAAMSQTLWSVTDPDGWRAALAGYPAAIEQRSVARLPALDAWYREMLPAAVTSRTPMHVTHEEMVRVTEWKMARGVWRAPNLVLVRGNTPASVIEASSRAAELRDQPAKAIAALIALAGVGPATASAVLAIMAPEHFPFFDELVAAQVADLGPVAWTTGYYRKYAAALIARAAQLGHGWTASMMEQALWSHAILHGTP